MTDTERKKIVGDLFDKFLDLPRNHIPVWQELAEYMFEAGRTHEKSMDPL